MCAVTAWDGWLYGHQLDFLPLSVSVCLASTFDFELLYDQSELKMTESTSNESDGHQSNEDQETNHQNKRPKTFFKTPNSDHQHQDKKRFVDREQSPTTQSTSVLNQLIQVGPSNLLNTITSSSTTSTPRTPSNKPLFLASPSPPQPQAPESVPESESDQSIIIIEPDPKPEPKTSIKKPKFDRKYIGGQSSLSVYLSFVSFYKN